MNEANSDDDEEKIALQMFKESHAPLPDQKANCEVCEVSFRVTAYSATGPDGNGFLCADCTQDLEASRPKRAKKATQGRKTRSDALDLVSSKGSKTLMSLCVETLAKNVDMAEDLGDLPPEVVDRVSALLSKKRLINPANVGLFLQATSDTITVYDCAKLESDDFIRMFQMVPRVKTLRIRNCIQFKNNVMDYLIECPVELENFSIYGANLIGDEHWNRFIMKKGAHLRTLKISYTDNHFGDEQLELLTIHCPNLNRLKISHNQKVTSDGLMHIAKLKNLQHLTLEIYQYTETLPYVAILNSIGSNLRTFCIRKVEYLEDAVLEAIHNNCTNLRKLCISMNEVFSDKAFEALFTNWSNPPLVNIDLNKCRQMDSSVPDNPDNIGLCSAGFIALMKHSGSALRHLNVCDCRHISPEAFQTVFSPFTNYERLETLDVSFCWGITNQVIEAIFRSVNNGSLRAVKTFGNFKVTNMWAAENIPKGVFLIGVPTGWGMHIEGDGKRLVWGS